MLLYGFLFSYLVVSAIFGHSFFGLSARKVLLVLALIFVLFVLHHTFFFKDLYEVLIEDENIALSGPMVSKDLKFPLYGKNAEYYFVIYPAIHYKIPIQNNCSGFRPNNRDTWCGEAKMIPVCNTPQQSDNCTVVTDL